MKKSRLNPEASRLVDMPDGGGNSSFLAPREYNGQRDRYHGAASRQPCVLPFCAYALTVGLPHSRRGPVTFFVMEGATLLSSHP